MKTAQSNIFCLQYVKDRCNLLYENRIVSLSYVNEYKVRFITDTLKNLKFCVHHKNYGCIEIVGIFFTKAVLKYLSDS